MKKKSKIKEIKLPMKFNPGLQKYEPTLPILKKGKKPKIKVDWSIIILLILAILALLTIIFFGQELADLFGFENKTWTPPNQTWPQNG